MGKWYGQKCFSKYLDKAVVVPAKVVKIEEYNKGYFKPEKDEYKYKTVFYCASSKGEPRMCVYWNNTTVQEGDEVLLTGRMKNDVFLAWDMKITKRGNPCGDV